MPPRFFRYIIRKRWTLLAILIIIPLGFYSKAYSGPASHWVNNSLGGILYVIFWSLLFSALFLRVRSWKIASVVFLATCLLEVLQLWHPPVLETVRSTFLGVTLLGNSFSWLDLLHYLAGFLASWSLIRFLRKRENPH